jgi:hypothetical protein
MEIKRSGAYKKWGSDKWQVWLTGEIDKNTPLIPQLLECEQQMDRPLTSDDLVFDDFIDDDGDDLVYLEALAPATPREIEDAMLKMEQL